MIFMKEKKHKLTSTFLIKSLKKNLNFLKKKSILFNLKQTGLILVEIHYLKMNKLNVIGLNPHSTHDAHA